MSIKKEELLNKAEALFYGSGFHAVGLKQIINEANVAVMTLYNHFDSKDALILEVLKKREERYFTYLKAAAEQTEKPAVGLAKSHIKWLEEYGSRGCLFLRAKEEFGADPNNKIVQFVNQHKQHLLHYFWQYGLDKQDALKLMLLFEGITALVEIKDINEIRIQFLELAELI
ncbi:MAG: TetR/AcrR family transcriptional regulator [Peptococcaceae bacterium]